MKEQTILPQMLYDFEQMLINDEKSELTVEKYLRDIRQFVLFLGDMPLEKTTVLAYKSALEEKYALTSANSMLAAINAFFNFINRPELCVKQFKIQRNTFCNEDKELTKSEYLRLVKTAQVQKNERLSLILQTICATGIRVSELQYITLEAVKRGEANAYSKNKSRKIFIVSSLQKKLLGYCKRNGIKSGQVFVTKNGNPISRTNIWREMKKLCLEADINPNKVFPHNLRHLFARVFYEIEKDIAKLADMLGHSSINTTRIYIITTGTEHRKRMENMRLII